MSNSKILFILSGSIAAFKACAVVSKLVQEGHQVRAVATNGALRFVGTATLEGLTGQPVVTDLWEEGRAMDHIHLTRWADFAVLCPASANSISKLAHGYADDILGALALAWPAGKPFHVFPAMNTQMLANAETQAHLRALADRGYLVHESGGGNLACGETGEGRLLEPEEIVNRLRALEKPRVLVTAGATRERIDGIRFLSNVSTGQTGATLAELLEIRGYRVTYLHGEGAKLPRAVRERAAFTDFRDLRARLREKLAAEDFAAVIHCAAVSDYSVAEVNGRAADDLSKLNSSAEELILRLRRNGKILSELREFSRGRAKVIGFKLTLNAGAEENLAAARALLGPGIDAVVANDWSQVAADRSRHPGRFVTSRGATEFASLGELATLLDRWLSHEGAEHGSLS